MTDSLSLAVHAFASRVSMSVPIDETLLPKIKLICIRYDSWYHVTVNCIKSRYLKFLWFSVIRYLKLYNFEQIKYLY